MGIAFGWQVGNDGSFPFFHDGCGVGMVVIKRKGMTKRIVYLAVRPRSQRKMAGCIVPRYDVSMQATPRDANMSTCIRDCYSKSIL